MKHEHVTPPGDLMTRAAIIVTDYERTKADIFCPCAGRGGAFHNANVRCAVCAGCGQRIKGIWFNEHEGECLAQQSKGE